MQLNQTLEYPFMLTSHGVRIKNPLTHKHKQALRLLQLYGLLLAYKYVCKEISFTLTCK